MTQRELKGFVSVNAILEDAARLWKAQMLAYDGKNWRWSYRMDCGQVIATPYNKAIKERFEDFDTFYAWTLEVVK